MPTPEIDETESLFKVRCVETLMRDQQVDSLKTAIEVCNYLWSRHREQPIKEK